MVRYSLGLHIMVLLLDTVQLTATANNRPVIRVCGMQLFYINLSVSQP